MLFKPFKINANDYTSKVKRDGMSITYTPIEGLSPKYTLDGTLHDDILGNKASIVIQLNPVTPADGKAIIADYRAKHMYVTAYDLSTDSVVVLYCKPTSVLSTPALVRNGSAVYWQIGDLTFMEM